MLVSPYIQSGTIIRTVIDHASVNKTICNRWNLPPLTARDEAAQDLGESLTLDRPRDDLPQITPRVFPRVPRPEDEPLNDFHKALLAIVVGIIAKNEIDDMKSIP